MRSTGHSIALSDSMLFIGFGPVLTLKLISHAPIPENTRTSQHWKLRLQVCEDQPVIVWREGINFFHQGRDQLGGRKPARTADLLLLWALNCFGLETFASLCQKDVSPFFFVMIPHCKMRNCQWVCKTQKFLLTSSYFTE